MATNNHTHDLKEKEHLLLPETAAMNPSSSFFNEPAATIRPPCTSCGTAAPSFSFGSPKRPSSQNPTTHHQPPLKKPNTTTHSKIPLSPPPFLRRRSSDPDNPPLSPLPNVEPECAGTPLSNAVASNKLPPRPPTLKRAESDPIPSPAKISSGPSDSHHPEDNSEEGVVGAVSVEKIGEALILHFKCPCGTEYQILLLEGHCYYKLI